MPKNNKIKYPEFDNDNERYHLYVMSHDEPCWHDLRRTSHNTDIATVCDQCEYACDTEDGIFPVKEKHTSNNLLHYCT